MTDLDYSEQRKAIAHDRTRYVWENESGYWLIGHELKNGPEIAGVMSDAFEYGFSTGWDKAMEQRENN